MQFYTKSTPQNPMSQSVFLDCEVGRSFKLIFKITNEDLFDDLQIKYHKEQGEFHKQKGEDLSKIKELKRENKKLKEELQHKEMGTLT